MRSDTVKKGFDKAPHRALLRATGLKDERKKATIFPLWEECST